MPRRRSRAPPARARSCWPPPAPPRPANPRAAREAASGEFLALLDADDRWPPDKLARQLEAIGDAGMVYGDMTVIDGAGEIVRESWLSLVWDGEPPSGTNAFGALLAANAAT